MGTKGLGNDMAGRGCFFFSYEAGLWGWGEDLEPGGQVKIQ